jgi:hypothetical protein
VFLVELIPDSALDPLVPGAIARVGSCLQPADPRRLEVERLSDPHMCPRRKRAELLATQFIDKRAETLLAQVPSKHAKNPPTKSIPQLANAVPAADSTTNGSSPAHATDG